MWVMAAIAIASTVMQMMQQSKQAAAQKKAAKQQEAAAAESKALAEKNAQLEETQTQETLRKQALSDKAEEAAARAAAAASGFYYDPENPDKTGSIVLSLAAQAKENKTQLDYAKTAGASRADIIRKGGDYSYSQGMAEASRTKTQAAGSRWGMAATGLKLAGQAYNVWGGTGSGGDIDV